MREEPANCSKPGKRKPCQRPRPNQEGISARHARGCQHKQMSPLR